MSKKKLKIRWMVILPPWAVIVLLVALSFLDYALFTEVTTAVYGIGTFVSTYYANALLNILGTDSYTKTWTVSAVIFAIMGIVELVLDFGKKKAS